MRWLSSLFLALGLGACKTSSTPTGAGLQDTPATPLKHLVIYYGWPSAINGSKTLAEAAAALDGYDVLVLGGGLEDPTHGDHRNTRRLIQGLRDRAEIFGYIPLGESTHLSEEDISSRVRKWEAMGVAGIFFDEAGYDYKTTRERQNMAFDLAHRAKLLAFANAWDPDHLFDDSRVPVFNPRSRPTALRRGDCYLYESFGVRLDEPEEEAARRIKLGKLARARSLGVRLFGITTAKTPQFFDARAWKRVLAQATKGGLEGVGWGEYEFSAPDNRMPRREMR